MSGTELPRGTPLSAHAQTRPGSSTPQPSGWLPAAPGAWMERRLSTGPGPGARQGHRRSLQEARPPGRRGSVGEPERCSRRPPQRKPFVRRGAARLSPPLSTRDATCPSSEYGPCTQLATADHLTAGPRHPRSCLCGCAVCVL